MFNDKKFMAIALEQAQIAGLAGEVPVGACVVKDGRVISVGLNTREGEQSSLGHAEIGAIDAACKALGTWRLEDCTVYVTLEPCPMCAGALINARVKRVVYGASDQKTGCFGSLCNMAAMPFPTVPQITRGMLEMECTQLLQSFFEELRSSGE